MKETDKEKHHSMFFKMIQVDKLHRSIFERMHSAFGIHRSQHRILMYISRKDTCPSQKDIAEHFGISYAAVAVSLKKLEDACLITRESREEDSRFNTISLTPEGKSVVDKSIDFFTSCDKQMFKDFSESDFAHFEECLEKMTSGLCDFEKDLINKL